MEKLIANLASAKVSQKTLQGRNYLVAPVSMIVEGVWKGSAGPVYYEGNDIAMSVPAWNAKPITINHPETSDGTKVSGASPESLEKHAVGMVLNTKYDKRKKRLVAEAWFEIDRLNKVPGADIVQAALHAGEKLEVSTGLYIDAQPLQGTFANNAYVAKATNYRPDHLAIILQGEGACSLKDGAGLLVNKAEKPSRPERLPELVGNAKNLSEIVDQVRQAVYATHEVMTAEGPNTYCYIVAVYDKYVIFEKSSQGESAYFRQNYAMESGLVKLIGNATPVTRKVTYSVQNQKQENMERKDLISKLGSEHAEFVTNMSDDQFKAFEKALAPAPAPAPVQSPAKIVCNSVSELLEHASDGVKNQVNDALDLAVKTREALIDKIVANTKDSFTKEELASFTTAHLNKLATVIAAPAPRQNQGVYAGEAFVGNQLSGSTASSESVPLPPPSFAKS